MKRSKIFLGATALVLGIVKWFELHGHKILLG